jgi:hypothetical protein
MIVIFLLNYIFIIIDDNKKNSLKSSELMLFIIMC